MSKKYDDYLKSEEWIEKRDAALEAAGHRCQLCNSKNSLNVHHRTYENVYNEKPSDLIVLCRKCHKIFHENRSVTRTKSKKREQGDADVFLEGPSFVSCPRCSSPRFKLCKDRSGRDKINQHAARTRLENKRKRDFT